jgi:predicted amidophosphoribosyltransferase
MAAWRLWLDTLRLRPAITTAAQWLGEFWSLVIPTECVVCGREDRSLCPGCAAALRRATVRPYRAEEAAEALPEAGRPGEAGLPPPGPGTAAEFVPLPVLAAGRYRRELSQTLLAFKNHGHTDLAPVLAAALGGTLHHAVAELVPRPPVLLVPVPSRPASIRRRGYDPVWLLLRTLEARILLPAGAQLVPAAGHTLAAAALELVPRAIRNATGWAAGSQKSLGRAKRRGNVAGTLAVRRRHAGRVRGRTCLIVDDVLTTGATIAEMARVLRGAGAHVAGAVVVAATQAPSAPAEPAGDLRRASGNPV